MATVDYWVDPAGNDANTGLSKIQAKEHLSAVLALAAFSSDITDEIIINVVKGSSGSPTEYEETDNDNELKIDSLVCVDGGTVSIQIEEWDQNNYEDGDSPIGGSSFDPKEERLGVLGFTISIENSNDIYFKGLEIKPVSRANTGIALDESCSFIEVHYCKFTSCFYGVYVGETKLQIYNSWFYDNTYGIYSIISKVFVMGDNYIEESKNAGIVSTLHSLVVIMHWDDFPTEHFTTTISTSTPVSNYSAISVKAHSTATVLSDPGNCAFPYSGFLKILNTSKFDQADYYGVYLESKSLFLGNEITSFRDSNYNDDQDTVPVSNQFVGTEDSTVA